MKHILLSLFILVAINAAAQNADQRVGELINEGDWFALAEEYPRLKDSMQVEFLQPMAEALLAKYFNQSDKAIAAMTTLLSNYQEENERLMEITKYLKKQYKKLEIENSVIKIGSLTILTAFSAYYIYRNLK